MTSVVASSSGSLFTPNAQIDTMLLKSPGSSFSNLVPAVSSSSFLSHSTQQHPFSSGTTATASQKVWSPCAPVATRWKYICIALASAIVAVVLWRNSSIGKFSSLYSIHGGHQETASPNNTKRRLNEYWRNWVPNFSDPATVEKKPTPFPKVLLFITTHFSEPHVRFFQRCWPHSIANSLLLQNAEVLICVTGTANRTLLEALFANNALQIHEVDNPGYHTGAKMALNLAGEHRWFDSYDWVIRQNPDVIVRNDTEILASITDPAVDGIFVNCRPGGMETMLQTDWSAFHPGALRDDAFTKDMHSNAERQFTIDMYPILNSGRFVWLPKAEPEAFGHCRVVGDNVVHDHEYFEKCESDFAG